MREAKGIRLVLQHNCIVRCLKNHVHVRLFIADELNEWLEKATESSVELKTLSAVYSFVRRETEIKCWQFIETRLTLLLGQYKISDAVSPLHEWVENAKQSRRQVWVTGSPTLRLTA